MSRKWLGCVFLIGLLFAGCAPVRPSPPTPSPSASRTPAPTASATLTPTITLSATPAPTTVTPSITPSPTPTPPESIAAWAPVYRPNDSARAVATVRWSEDGRLLYYALSPESGGYLLDWFEYDLASQTTQAIRSPDFGFADAWRKAAVGFPRTSEPFSELLGFVSPQFKKVIYPNAGFPTASTNPNYIFVILADNRSRQQVLGPIFRGTVGKAAWIDFETRLIFDYRFDGRTVIYMADLLKGRTETLFELGGNDVEWRVSPDEKYLLIPQDGQSQLLALDGGETLLLDTPRGLARPQWSQDSQTLYFWAGSENRILSYTLADQIVHPVVVRRDLEPFSPIPPVYGMPFAISSDGQRVAFWWENWIWLVELTAAQ